jgi:hypothetical protein
LAGDLMENLRRSKQYPNRISRVPWSLVINPNMRYSMRAARFLLVAGLLLAFPAGALAQAVISGSVKDSSGAVLPGVTVEAASPALIEKVRTAVSDGNGVYRIEDLRPGTYSVTFTLPGFKTYKREGIVLTGSFTASVDGDMAVGGLEETVTVTGESPIVDVQSAKHEQTITNEVLKSIPTVRSYNAMVVVVPGVVTNLNDTVTGTATTQFPIHGGRNNEGRMTIDGLNVGNPPGGNQPPAYVADVGNAEEVVFSTSGGLGENETGGLTMNVVPKTGGNRISGSLFFSGTNEDLMSDNFKNIVGLSAPTPFKKIYDLNGSFGGPIKQDKIWYFINARTQGSKRINANQFYNLNAGKADQWLYAPDLSRPGFSDRTWENVSGRITWQANAKNKISGFWDEQATCRKCEGQTSGITDPVRLSPEAGSVGATKPLRVMQATWSSPMTNRLLLDAGFGGVYYGWGSFEREPNDTRNLTRVVEQCAAGCAANGNIPGLTYRSQDFNVNNTGSFGWKANASYVTGSHSMKIGYQGTWMVDKRSWMTNSTELTYRVSNGVPNQLTMSLTPFQNDGYAGWHAAFWQEQYTRGRLTLQGAVRYDIASSWYPEQTLGPSKYFPNKIVLPETKGVNSYQDITPRMGAAFDLFGNGKTALKMSTGRYLEGVGVSTNYANANPTLRIPTTTGAFGVQGITRTWTDANSNFQPDCELNNLQQQDLRGTGGDFCGIVSNVRWGQNILTNNYDPDLLKGWGVRPSDWSFSAAVQQQLLRRLSVEVSYNRRSFRGFTVLDNTLSTPADYTQYSITAPQDPRLPGGGGYQINGLLDVVPNLAGQILNTVTDSAKYGDTSQVFNGVDVTVNARQGGFTFQGGTSTGQTTSDFCDVRANLPELVQNIGAGLQTSAVGLQSPYCQASSGFLTQFRSLASYVIPKVDVQVSGVFQSKPGPALLANLVVQPGQFGSTLPRNFTGVPNVTVNLIEPGTLYGNRINQLDLRLAKLLRFGGTRTMIGIDLYNALNDDAILTYNNTFVPGGTWLQPQTVVTARMIRFSAEFTF